MKSIKKFFSIKSYKKQNNYLNRHQRKISAYQFSSNIKNLNFILNTNKNNYRNNNKEINTNSKNDKLVELVILNF